MGSTRADFDKTAVVKPKFIPATEAMRAHAVASGEDFKDALAEFNAPTEQEQAFLDQFAR
ncbi:hypothetical protein [Lysobacter sp. CA199]|uniref:hypothetical protein n=1 Tax=Lysobacter sp. CA199 TaxID=3455608 RepID=UPI003F8D7B99